MSQGKKSIARSSLIYSLLVVLLLGVSAEVCWISQIYREHKRDVKEAEQKYLVHQEAVLKAKVDTVIQYLNHLQADAPTRLKRALRCRVAHSHKPKDAPFLIGQLFVIDMAKNEWQVRCDAVAAHKLPDLIKEFSRQKLRDDDFLFPNLSFLSSDQVCCLRADGSILRGAVGSLQELESQLQDEARAYISSVRFGEDGYIYAFRYDGHFLCHVMECIVGTNQLGTSDANGVKIFQELIKLAKNNGGFLEYLWNKPSSGKNEKKLAFVRGFEPWQWVIGTGVYLEDLNQVVASHRAAHERRVYANLSQIVILMGLAMIVTLAISSRMSSAVRREFEFFDSFFHRAANERTAIDIDKLEFVEFQRLGRAANDTISQLQKTGEALTKSEERLRTTLEATEDGLWELNFGQRADYLSERIATMVGYEPERCQEGLAFLDDIIHPEDELQWRRALAQMEKKAHDDFVVQFRLGGKDGTWHYILARGKCVERDDEGKPVRALGTHTDVTDRVIADKRLALTQYVVDHSADAVYMLGKDKHFRYINDTALSSLGYSADEFTGMTLSDIHTEDDRDIWQASYEEVKESGRATFVSNHRRKDGSVFPVEVMASHISYRGEDYCVAFVRDITKRRQLEGQLRQSQKMEAIGRLAGGIAHDFNNQLTVILGFCSVLEIDKGVSGNNLELVKEIQGAASRSAQLTKQLLAFSRKQVLKPEVLPVNDVLSNLEKTLRRIIGEDVELSIDLPKDNLPVKVDRSQFEQAIMNLCLNARDAMPEGGQLNIDVNMVELKDKQLPRSEEKISGSFVSLAISDTGSGMDEQTLTSIFEPFFTTKAMGKGTGLGLAMVYGFVRQSGGHVDIESELGSGSCFWIYLPEAQEDFSQKNIEEEPLIEGPHEECTILVVEDERAVRHLTATILKRAGYKIIEAADAFEALKLSDSHDEKIDLLLTDVVMPGQCGPELAKLMNEKRPETKVLYMTGYIDRAAASLDISDERVNLITKPFTPQGLREAVVEAMANSTS